MKRRRKRIQRVLLISWCVLLLILTGTCIFLETREKGKEENPTGNQTENQMGKQDSVLQGIDAIQDIPTPTPTPTPEPEPEAIVRYPQFEAPNTDALLKQKAEELLSDMELLLEQEEFEKKPQIIIDYESYRKEALVSVRFLVKAELPEGEVMQDFMDTYNLAEDVPLTGEELFTKPCFETVKNKLLETLGEEGASEEELAAFAEQLPADATTFTRFLFKEEGVSFFVEDMEQKEREVVLPYEQIRTYMKVSLSGASVKEKIRDLDPDKPMIALTFDDGPHTTNTKKLVDLLEQYGGRATFFMLGSRAEFYPETVKYVYDSGNEVASHTYSHANLTTLSEEEFWYEIRKANEVIAAITGEEPTYLRPPYGSKNDFVRANAPMPLVCWDIDSEDWKSRNKDAVIEMVLKDVKDGRIALMHDIHAETIDAMAELIPELIARGYQLVTVRELFYYKNIEVKNGEVYYNAY